MKDKLFALFLYTYLAFTNGQLDTSVCTGQIPGPNDPPGPPSLPNVFEVHIEANINNRNYTSEYHIWYDQVHNQVATHVDNAGTKSENLYRFDTNEFYHVDRDNGICTVQPLFRSPQLFLFGTATGDMATMKTPNQFLHFNETGIQQKWINQTVVRGITCNLWRSCLYWDSIKATMIVDWYFSAPVWTTSRLSPQLPVRAHVYGKTVMTNGQKRSFDHMYEFADFNPNPDKKVAAYQTPAGVYCQRAKNIKPLPTPASSFHFTAEIVFGQSISRIKEWYDSDLNLVRYDYDPLGIIQKYGSLPLTQVHDFNTGVAYIIDTLRGNCTATPISNTGFDVRNADPTHVRIRTSKEFFYFDKAAYIYEGQRPVRSINSDVWIAQRNDWPVPNSPNSTWEWYFATPNYTTSYISAFGNPTRMVLDAGLGQHYVYNIYDYNERRPMIWSYDISNCFNYTERKDFSFKLSGSYRKLVSGNMEMFRDVVLRAIVKAGASNKINLSPLRVFNIQIDYADNNDIIVQFTLLDKAPQLGDVSNPKPENSLSIVAKSISGAINGGLLIVKLQVSPLPPAYMVAKQYSLSPGRIVKDAYYKQNKQGVSTSSGVSGGAMAGMGVALLVVFFVIGVAATYFYYRRQGGAFAAKKFDDEDITSSDS